MADATQVTCKTVTSCHECHIYEVLLSHSLPLRSHNYGLGKVFPICLQDVIWLVRIIPTFYFTWRWPWTVHQMLESKNDHIPLFILSQNQMKQTSQNGHFLLGFHCSSDYSLKLLHQQSKQFGEGRVNVISSHSFKHFIRLALFKLSK